MCIRDSPFSGPSAKAPWLALFPTPHHVTYSSVLERPAGNRTVATPDDPRAVWSSRYANFCRCSSVGDPVCPRLAGTVNDTSTFARLEIPDRCRTSRLGRIPRRPYISFVFGLSHRRPAFQVAQGDVTVLVGPKKRTQVGPQSCTRSRVVLHLSLIHI